MSPGLAEMERPDLPLTLALTDWPLQNVLKTKVACLHRSFLRVTSYQEMLLLPMPGCRHHTFQQVSVLFLTVPWCCQCQRLESSLPLKCVIYYALLMTCQYLQLPFTSSHLPHMTKTVSKLSHKDKVHPVLLLKTIDFHRCEGRGQRTLLKIIRPVKCNHPRAYSSTASTLMWPPPKHLEVSSNLRAKPLKNGRNVYLFTLIVYAFCSE